jgi:hypothetical protein
MKPGRSRPPSCDIEQHVTIADDPISILIPKDPELGQLSRRTSAHIRDFKLVRRRILANVPFVIGHPDDDGINGQDLPWFE